MLWKKILFFTYLFCLKPLKLGSLEFTKIDTNYKIMDDSFWVLDTKLPKDLVVKKNDLIYYERNFLLLRNKSEIKKCIKIGSVNLPNKVVYNDDNDYDEKKKPNILN